MRLREEFGQDINAACGRLGQLATKDIEDLAPAPPAPAPGAGGRVDERGGRDAAAAAAKNLGRHR